jgi:small subunit ribosomal protein S16
MVEKGGGTEIGSKPSGFPHYGFPCYNYKFGLGPGEQGECALVFALSRTNVDRRNEIMLKIRLRRMGSTHRPFYRVVVSDSRKTPTARAMDEVGYYDPRSEPDTIKIDGERVEHWVQRGAQMTPTVRKLLRRQKDSSSAA